MTDKEKIVLLEKDNQALRTENNELRAEQQRLAQIAHDMEETVAVLNGARREVEQLRESLSRFKKCYVMACEEAMKTTVKPYAKAVRTARREIRRVKNQAK